MAYFKLTAIAILIIVGGMATLPQPASTQQLSTNTAPPGEKTTPQPRLIIDSPTLDMGEVKPGSLVSSKFTFTNQGDAPLQILEVRPGCSCATAEFDSVVAPGQAGQITIPLNIYPEWAGQQFRKAAWVITNDPLTPQLRLIMSGQVAPLSLTTPPRVKSPAP